MSTFQVYILAADCALYEGPCESLVVPTLQGQYGILPHHSNMIGAVIPGSMLYKIPDQPVQTAAVSAGLVKVENNEVLVLVDSAERPEEIDENRAKRAADEAREALLQRKSIQEYRFAQANLARAINRLRVKSSYENTL
ncbi:MAG: ATP synthase F1 subunit epsilon [Eubacteriales bacterium]|nr:ATP synthase F1 subunit epsilon [Eubacteriales bacterium]